MENFRIEYPASEKVYINGTLFPAVKVGMRRSKLCGAGKAPV